MSYVPQRAGTGFAYTVDEVVGMGLYAAGAVSGGAADEAIAACDLESVRGRVFNRLYY